MERKNLMSYTKAKKDFYRKYRIDLWIKLNKNSKCKMHNLQVNHLADFFIKYAYRLNIDVYNFDLTEILDNQLSYDENKDLIKKYVLKKFITKVVS